jgi:hypothetical protein
LSGLVAGGGLRSPQALGDEQRRGKLFRTSPTSSPSVLLLSVCWFVGVLRSCVCDPTSREGNWRRIDHNLCACCV